MAFLLHLRSPPPGFITQLLPRSIPLRARRNVCITQHIRCLAVDNRTNEATILRRSANYHPDIWGYDFVRSLKSDYNGEFEVARAEKLTDDVRRMLNDDEVGSFAQLELIDTLQRLGIGYHFDKEIKRVLDSTVAINNNNHVIPMDLYVTALRFRLLRQHGYEISQDVFNGFKNEKSGFKACISEDVMGMLSLYEASHLALEGENILDEAKTFTSRHLKEISGTIHPNLAKKVNHSVENPLHHRMLRLEARRYIDEYERNGNANTTLLELAKLDFNMVQATHQKDLQDISMWWRDLGLGTKLEFSRDRLTESFLWAVGVIFEPQHSSCRKGITKLCALVGTIDDVYDVYGSLDELELFTDAVERWDLNAMEQLPSYMKTCFLALYNTINEMAYDSLKERDWNILPYLKKAWADLCKSYLIEAKWYYTKYTPTLEEYLNNAWISIAGHVVLVHSYFLLKPADITIKSLESIENYQNLIRWSSLIVRLWDDLGTSTAELERGDVPKAIQCFMFETGDSEEVAREHIKHIICGTWKKMNEEIVTNSLVSEPFFGIIVNLARMAQCTYQNGDGHGVSDGETRDRILSLLVTPISVMERKRMQSKKQYGKMDSKA